MEYAEDAPPRRAEVVISDGWGDEQGWDDGTDAWDNQRGGLMSEITLDGSASTTWSPGEMRVMSGVTRFSRSRPIRWTSRARRRWLGAASVTLPRLWSQRELVWELAESIRRARVA